MDDEQGSPDSEILCGFKIENLKIFHTGNLSSVVFPVEYNRAHIEKIPHIIIRIFIKTADDQFLIQKRSELKRTHKGRWTDSASGHVRYTPNFSYENIEENAKRELMEEMGTDLLAIRFVEFFNYQIDKQDSELSYIFLGICSNTCKLNLNEVDPKSGFYSRAELKKLTDIPRTEDSKPWVEISRKYWINILEGKFDNIYNSMIDEINHKGDLSYFQHLKEGKKNFTGLIIGRFQPLHLGHLTLIKKSFDYVHFLKIGIGSSQLSDTIENPFSFEERKIFIELSLSDEKTDPSSYTVYPIPDKFDFLLWMDSIFKIVGDFDVIFTNNLWIGRLFQLRDKHLVYGLRYEFTKFNGSKIRELLYDENPQWSELVPYPVFKYLSQTDVLKRIQKIKRISQKI